MATQNINLSTTRLGRDTVPIVRNIIHQYDDTTIDDLFDEIDKVAGTSYYSTVRRSETLNELIYQFQQETDNTSPLEIALPIILRDLWRILADEAASRFRINVNRRIEIDKFEYSTMDFEEMRKAVMPGTVHNEMVDEAINIAKMVDMLNPPEDESTKYEWNIMSPEQEEAVKDILKDVQEK